MRLKTVLYSGGYCWLALLVVQARSQVVQPVIMEYSGRASGKILLTNNTPNALAVTLEPRSFSIELSGHGTYRPLDASIHVELSAMSVKLQPQETYYVFYKASAETLPAWFTIYATFSPLHHGPDMSVRIQLPHTVYLYQKSALERGDLDVQRAYYSAGRKKVICELRNHGDRLGRAKVARASGPHGADATLGGFPMLPGMTRRLELDWTAKDPPDQLQVDFEHFSLKLPVVAEEAPDASVTNPAAGVVR